MTETTFSETSSASLLSQDVDDLLLHARGVALVRDLLAERGASCAELRAHSDALERLRGQLADLIRS